MWCLCPPPFYQDQACLYGDLAVLALPFPLHILGLITTSSLPVFTNLHLVLCCLLLTCLGQLFHYLADEMK